ncbi:MAG: tetratricopeptide repeat protein [Flavobacteriaceae bacterium]|nr:tetratricopeptide repeat protein [Flavobacteriaceae bacterium]
MKAVFKKYIILLLLLILQLTSYAQEANKNFVKANQLYQSKKYNEAITLYHKIENQKIKAAELYYNLANAYYKTNNVASSIYYYEKALQLAPNNKDIIFNLNFAKRMTIDNIEELPINLFQKLSRNFIQKLTYNTWSYVTLLFVALFTILFLLYHFSEASINKRILFISSILSILFFIFSLTFAFHTYKVSLNKKEAIIFAQQTNIKSAPILSSETVFELHEGTKVQILKSVDNWKKIKIADGQVGWIIATELKKL